MVNHKDWDFQTKHLQTGTFTGTLGKVPRLNFVAPFAVILIHPKFARSKVVSTSALESMISPKMSTIPQWAIIANPPSKPLIRILNENSLTLFPSVPLRYLPPSLGIYSSLCVSGASSLFSVCFIIFISSHFKLNFQLSLRETIY